MPEQPLARSYDLIIEAIGDELLVFDTTSSRAHSLNATAAAVWHACDGQRSPEEIAVECRIDESIVELALDRLRTVRLLDEVAVQRAARVSRRTILTRGVVAGAGVGVAIPVVRSIIAPSIALAASNGRVKGQAGKHCTGTSQCSPNSFCNASFHSCQRHLYASCSHTSSCYHTTTSASVCASGACGSCTTNANCPPSFPVCIPGYICVAA